MNLTIVQTLVCIGTPLLVGVALLRVLGLRFRNDPIGWMGRVFPCGALGLGLLLFLWMACGLDVKSLPLWGVPVIAGAVLLLARHGRTEPPEPSPITCPSKTARVLVVLICAVAGTTMLETMAHHATKPILRDDDASIWSIKGKLLYTHGQFDGDLGDRIRETTQLKHADYPLLNPLLQVWVHRCAGHPVDVQVRWPTWMWYFSLALMLFSACARRVGPVVGSLLVLLLVSAPVLRLGGVGTKADIIVAVGLLGLADHLLRGNRREDARRHFAMSAIFCAVMVWGKNEGMMLAIAVILAALFTWGRRALSSTLGSRLRWLLLIPLSVMILQVAFNRGYGLENDLATGGFGKDTRPLLRMFVENLPERTPIILERLWRNMFDDPFGPALHGIWPAFLVLLLLCPLRAFSRPIRFLTLAILAGWCGFFCVYVITFEELNWHLYTSSARVTAQMLPMAVLWGAHMYEHLQKSTRANMQDN